MTILRHNKLAALLLALAVFLSALGAPALAATCEHPQGAVVVAAKPEAAGAEIQPCSRSKGMKACCCGPKSHGGEAQHEQEQTSSARSDAGIQAEHCHCSMSAPVDQTGAVSGSKILLLAQIAFVPAAPFSIDLPVRQPWVLAAPTIGPPGGPVLVSGPSRAPPAVL